MDEIRSLNGQPNIVHANTDINDMLLYADGMYCWTLQKLFSFYHHNSKKTNMKASDVPAPIREFVYSKIKRNIRKYSVNRSGKFKVDIPWHDADREYWQLFKLTEKSAEITDFSVQRSGWCESQENITGKYIQGETEVPVGFVMVCVGIYPARCTIYCHESSNFQKLIS